MKYCINYYSDFPYLDTIDEINIKFEDVSKYSELIDFLDRHKHQRIHITVQEEKNIDYKLLVNTFKMLKQVYNYNFTLRIPRDDKLIKLLQENEVPFWIKTYVSNWDTLSYFLSLGVTDVTIIEEMGFEIDKVAAAAHQCGTKVRILPNVAQSSVMELEGIKKFFVRPEDIPDYEPYVDVCEFFGSPKSVETYYKIYAIDKQWFGDLSEIIISLNTPLDSRSVDPEFGRRRLKCGKRCLKGSVCKYCEIAKQFAKTLIDRNLIFKHKRY